MCSGKCLKRTQERRGSRSQSMTREHCDIVHLACEVCKHFYAFDWINGFCLHTTMTTRTTMRWSQWKWIFMWWTRAPGIRSQSAACKHSRQFGRTAIDAECAFDKNIINVMSNDDCVWLQAIPLMASARAIGQWLNRKTYALRTQKERA